MTAILTTFRRVRASDAAGVSAVHDSAWRGAYRGIIPGLHLERMIARRGPGWWLRTIRRGAGIIVLEFNREIVGYVHFGRNRSGGTQYQSEIFELYLAPECQGVGLGRRLFNAARRDLADQGRSALVVWALEDNLNAVAFYQRLGGKIVGRAEERFGEATTQRVAFAFEAC